MTQEPKSSYRICRVLSFCRVAPFTLRVTFDDGASQRIEFLPVLQGELFGPLRDDELFKQVRIDPEAQTLVWPNGADFDPATLHDWPTHAEAMQALANKWAAAPSAVPSDNG